MKRLTVLCIILFFATSFADAEQGAKYSEIVIPDYITETSVPRNRKEMRAAIIRNRQAVNSALVATVKLREDLLETRRIQREIIHTQRRIQNALHAVSPTRLDENDIQLAYLTEAFRDLYSRVESIQMLPIIQQSQRIPTRPAGFTISTATEKLGGDEFALYSRALDAFRKRFFDESRQIFRQLVTKFPQGRYVDRAYFWAGEGYFLEKRYSNALAYYQRVLGFSGSSRQDDAQYKIALSYMLMDEFDKAFEEFKRLIYRFPASEFVPLANENIAEIMLQRNSAITGAASTPVIALPQQERRNMQQLQLPMTQPTAQDSPTVAPPQEQPAAPQQPIFQQPVPLPATLPREHPIDAPPQEYTPAPKSALPPDLPAMPEAQAPPAFQQPVPLPATLPPNGQIGVPAPATVPENAPQTPEEPLFWVE